MKLVLTVNGGSLNGRSFELDQGYLALGRHENCALRFHHEYDPGVSSYHALIESTNGHFTIKDQQSTNGTYVNGAAVQEKNLQNGDIVRLGKEGPEIHVRVESVAPPPLPPPLPSAK